MSTRTLDLNRALINIAIAHLRMREPISLEYKRRESKTTTSTKKVHPEVGTHSRCRSTLSLAFALNKRGAQRCPM